jgi:uroporphyrin-III C-methyltransferase / precorrin-2 dehydrogenase / sirohydrochlorin ferrochelatase
VTEPRAPSEVSSARMDRLARLPVFLSLEGKRAVLAGGSAAAAWKAELLSAAGAAVEVFAPDVSEEMLVIVADPPHKQITLTRRDWRVDDLRDAVIAVGAFDHEQGAAIFADAARSAGVPVNVIDKPAFCDFSFGAIVNRSPLVIGISTDGAAPVFAQTVRSKLEALLPKGFARWAQAASRWREAVKASGLPFAARRKFWHLFTAQAVTHPDAIPGNNDFVGLLNAVRSLGAAVEHGSVTLVGAGPGDPELLTLRAVRALQSADVILFDDLVSREVLDFARREAKKLLVGKTGYAPSCKQDDINTQMVALAKQGKRVVRLKGGDPLIFARAGEEIAACREAGVAVDVVPGITAAQGAASRLGISLTGRGQSRRLQYVTGHARDGKLPDDIDWDSLADPATTTVIYMPAKTLGALVAKAIEHGLDPQTPAVAIACATRPDEAVLAETVACLPGCLAEQSLPGPLLVMIGRALAAELIQSGPADACQTASKA